MENKSEPKTTKVQRIGGYLHRVVPIKDDQGKVIDYFLKPFMVEFRPRDLLQVLVGATILAIPLAYTEETWVLGQEMPASNVAALALVSLVFMGAFVYFNFYRFNFRGHGFEYFKRVLVTYSVALIVVGLILTLIQKAPWQADLALAVKRTVIVAFPASMSATISDVLK
jgi:uncharacterized membrane protein